MAEYKCEDCDYGEVTQLEKHECPRCGSTKYVDISYGEDDGTTEFFYGEQTDLFQDGVSYEQFNE